MSEPESGCSHGDGGEEVACEFVVSRGDATEVFELVKEALDEIALFVERRIDGTLEAAVALGRDVWARAVSDEGVEDGASVVAAIGDRVARWREAGDQGWQAGFVGGLAGREQQPERQTPGIDHSVDLGAQSSTRTANGVIRAPFLPPAACWWARTIEVSMR